MELTRRDFLASGLVAIGAALAGPALWRSALAAPARIGESPYGVLGPPDANGIRLPAGFTSRIVARSGHRVAGHVWHGAPDGGATFGTDDGGWVYLSNAELGGGAGGVGAIRFDERGKVVDAYPILSGTSLNCAGGPTPWGTWLSCEEFEGGRVWECDPLGRRDAVVHAAMGVFTHEAAAVDPDGRSAYLTEDHPDGRFYRFRPARYPNLDRGDLEVARVADLGAVLDGGRSTVAWITVPDPGARARPTRRQVDGSTRFAGGEGCWYHDGHVVFTTKYDDRVWSYDTRDAEISLLFDRRLSGAGVLAGVDNITVADSGDAIVAEDGGDLDLVLITRGGTVARLLTVTGEPHRGSELAGPALDPSGQRLYFSSQRGFGDGVTYEVSGPFRGAPDPTAAPRAAPATTAAPSPPPMPDDGDGSPATAVAAGAGAAAVAVLAGWLSRRARRG